MSRKDYEKVAEILGRAPIGIHPKNNLVTDFAKMFKEDNDRFDVAKFRRAVFDIQEREDQL